MASPMAAVLIVNERRSDTVHARFLELFGRHFTFRTLSQKRIPDECKHPLIEVFMLRKRARKNLL